MIQFEKYQNMIRSYAWNLYRKTGYDYEDLEGQGYLIYCECVNKYKSDDVSGASFGTYLYSQLRALSYYIIKNHQDDSIPDGFTVIDDSGSISAEDFLSYAKGSLSLDAYEMLKFIVSFEWDRKGKHTPSYMMMVDHFRLPVYKIKELWAEIGSYWNTSGYRLYC